MAEQFGQRALAEAAGISVREVGVMLRRERRAAQEPLARLVVAMPRLEAAEGERPRAGRAGGGTGFYLRHVAVQAGVDAANLAHILTGRTKPSEAMLAKLDTAMIEHT